MSSDLRLDSVTISGNTETGPILLGSGSALFLQGETSLIIDGTIPDGSCYRQAPTVVDSLGGNLESPGDSCDLSPLVGDQVNVTSPSLSSLGDFGGLTRTVLPWEDSPALDGAFCTRPTDQRGDPRALAPDPCETGSVERQPLDPTFADGFSSGDTSYWSSSLP